MTGYQDSGPSTGCRATCPVELMAKCKRDVTPLLVGIGITSFLPLPIDTTPQLHMLIVQYGLLLLTIVFTLQFTGTYTFYESNKFCFYFCLFSFYAFSSYFILVAFFISYYDDVLNYVISMHGLQPVMAFTWEVNPWLTKLPLKLCGGLVNLGLTHWGWNKMATIFQTHFQMDFLEWKYMNFD